MSIYDISLPKWPAMVVSGNPVTPEQAQDIIFTLDRRFHYGISKAPLGTFLGIPSDIGYYHIKDDTERAIKLRTHWHREEEIRKTIGVVTLDYLATDRISSSRIGGNHGWVDWNGNVFCANYNIGKWPSVNEVRKEWATIAKLFPYLDLRCTLWANETSEVENFPLVAFVVKNGRVRVVKPKKHEDFIPSWKEEDMVVGVMSRFDEGLNIRNEKKVLEVYAEWLKRKNIVVPKWDDIPVEIENV